MFASSKCLQPVGSLRNLSPAPIAPASNRSICHKSKLEPKKVYRWPYEKRQFTWYNFWLDPFTKGKFGDNTKIIQVEGNVAAGKEQFARKLADELGMAYFPPIDLETLFLNQHGFDYRALNPLLPERLRFCDMTMFHENPSRHSVIHMQYHLFKMRYFQYVKAVQHLFNTGQGVVLSRSAFTERVFVEAMHNLGWLPKGYLRGDGVRFYDWKLRYMYIRNLVLGTLHRPHLTIYLDTPVDTCLQRIKEDPDPVIANSKALCREFLEEIERAYIDVVLPKQEFRGHVLTVEHPHHRNDEEIQDVVDMIEDLDFEYDHGDYHFQDWYARNQFTYHNHRRRLTTTAFLDDLHFFIQPYYDIAGMGDSITDGDLKLREALYENHVHDVGYFRDFVNDIRAGTLLKAYFGYQNFHECLDHHLRSDFR